MKLEDDDHEWEIVSLVRHSVTGIYGLQLLSSTKRSQVCPLTKNDLYGLAAACKHAAQKLENIDKNAVET